jgi:predicted nucleic acid-binding protein
MAGYGQALLLDWSAYARVLLADRSSRGRTLPQRAVGRFAAAVSAGEIWTCAPFRLEASYFVTAPDPYQELRQELAALPSAEADADTWARAEQAQAELILTRGVSHRVKLADLLVAAIADQHTLGVLHYDHDYDVISVHTSLTFDSVWIAERGAID